MQVRIDRTTGIREVHVRDSRNVTCDVARSIANVAHAAFSSSLSLGLDRTSVGSAGWQPSKGDERTRGVRRMQLGPGNRSRTTWAKPPRAGFHLSCTYVCYGYRGLSRVQVSADYSSGSCESDFVVVVTSNRQRSRFLPEQNRSLCAVKFLITVLDSHKLLLIRYHYCT